MIWSKTFKLIEEALGFELHDWQKNYISMESDYIPEERQCGATTAFILRHLINYEREFPNFKNLGAIRVEYWNVFPCDYSVGDLHYTNQLYPRMVADINHKLRSVGIKTCYGDRFE